MRPDKYVPDYIIFDELKRKREEAIRDDRPQLEVPRYMPMWSEEPATEEEETEEKSERGEVVIPMW